MGRTSYSRWDCCRPIRRPRSPIRVSALRPKGRDGRTHQVEVIGRRVDEAESLVSNFSSVLR